MDTLFFKAESKKNALELLRRYKKELLIVNGGTDAVLHLIEKKVSPSVIMHIADLPELHVIICEKGVVRIGGAVTYREMLESPILAPYGGLAEAVKHLASPPVRAIATPAGNVCTAAPSADCTTMLMSLGAKLHFVTADSERMVPLNEFYTGTYRTVRKPDELLDYIEIPAPQRNTGTGYCRLSRRKAQDIGKVLVGVYVCVENDVLEKVSISLGALNPYAVRATALEEALTGKSCAEAVAYASENFPPEAALRPSYFKAYKQDTTCAAVATALEMAIAEAKKGVKV